MTTLHFAKVWSAQTSGLAAKKISVEVDVTKNTLQKFTIVGLPDKAVAESRDRVSAALKNSGFSSPKHQNEKVVVSLAPAEMRKEGPIFDLAIALSYLKACGDIDFDPSRTFFFGELSLSGEVMSMRGALALALLAKREGATAIFVPKENVVEAALVDGLAVFGAETLSVVVEHVRTDTADDDAETKSKTKKTKRRGTESRTRVLIPQTAKTELARTEPDTLISFDDIVGQESAKRGLAIAASGGHNILLYGPPGTGKTMLAKALPGILPPLSFDECMEVTAIHSIAGTLREPVITAPPFRAPHHTSSYVSLVGGGTVPKPGEVTLAHRGVLFADEFPEFGRHVIEALREPLEERAIRISRARGFAHFPASFILVAAMNPCPCGNAGSSKTCTCSRQKRSAYRDRLSGPIVDRIDLFVEVSHVPHDKLLATHETGETKRIREAVRRARDVQSERFKTLKRNVTTNADLSPRELSRLVSLTPATERALRNAAHALDISPRTYHRLVKLARTIADLDGDGAVTEEHIMEALQYRPKQDDSY